MTGRWSVLRLSLAAVETLAAIGVAGFVLNVPLTAGLRPFLTLLLGLVIAFAIFQPGTAGGVVLLLSLGIGYVLITSLGDALGGALPPVGEVLLIAVALFLIHAIDSFRGTLPIDVAIDRSVLVRWLRRLAEALVPTVGLGALVLTVPGRGAGPALWFIGAVALFAAIGIPTVWMRRKPWLDKARSRLG
jgi:hypothetical protein